ncbi:aspartate 4-decarboxylase [Clostridium sp.]|uniref:aspartate 4-decarboxylase n=1 Tax=Clostridium sp. TaxID=1506 RepID=UPI001A4B6A46|nr:aspartate 4-decarboxylase [Clostridium sp.]MBK5237077.1 aspartate 4-decarboxylase [Clostridium sp.]
MNKLSLQRKEIEEVYGKISPFELKDKLIDLAEESKKSGAQSLLDAGRGNPNWIAASPREAFFTFGQFAVEESRSVWSDHDLAGMPKKEDISKRFIDFIRKHKDDPGIELLRKMINYGVTVKGFNADDWIYELVDGIIGDNYPQPDRMLTHVENVVNDYLIQELCYNEPLEGKFKTFAVEGATAAMCYIFDTLIANNILSKGDKIAIMAPIFTPYLEIPHLPRYNFEVIKVLADEMTDDGRRTWQYSSKEIEKMRDSSIKALFIVNPSNPASVAMKPENVKQLKNIVDNDNPDLMIISDDVYSTFVDDFRSIMADLPYNTIGVYSYSKYFGVTGWRLGTISLYEHNVFNKLLKEQDEDKKERARIRYGGISTDPDNIDFIDRIVADSRQVALNHTAGLSTPQQVQMAFFSLFAIVDKENRYKKLTKDICRRRKRLLFEGLGVDLQTNPFDASYYTQFDLLEWAARNYNIDFVKYLQESFKPVDILIRLAEQSSIVLLGSSGFNGPEWSIRISLANLNDESYSKIGEVLHKVMKDYANEWNESKTT